MNYCTEGSILFDFFQLGQIQDGKQVEEIREFACFSFFPVPSIHIVGSDVQSGLKDFTH